VGTINALAMCVGNLVTNIFGLPSVLGRDNTWPYLLALIIIPAAVHYVGLPFCVESPKYLFITKDNPEKAKEGLFLFRFISSYLLYL
jgi:SP family facilitated glucose transporter-like MFS transporter 1